MNALVLEFEKHTQLGPVNAAKLLGYAYSSYAQYKSGARPLKPYLKRHIRVVMMLPREQLKVLIAEVLADD